MLRIISGKYKNKKLYVPESGTRPLSDRIKTTIFDLLADEVNKADVLDLFAGSGSFGFEALSRGAKSVTFIEKAKSAVITLKRNIINLNVSEQSRVIPKESYRFVKTNKDFYKIIFLDPPFPDPEHQKFQIVLMALNQLKKNGILIFRYEYKEADYYERQALPEGIERVYVADFGRSKVAFYRN